MVAHRRLPVDAPSNIVFTLLEPFVLYWVAEELHSSGVMAVVTGGLFLANRRFRILNSESRIRGFSFWQSFVFILNGLVFFAIGLDWSEVVNGLERSGISLREGIYYGVLVTLVVIVVRIVASYAALFSTLIFRKSIVSPHYRFRNAWKGPIVLGWTGMRGVVSLAAACSIPVYLDNGAAFPQRDLILFISFVVIILTLFVQGLSLPFLLNRVKLSGLLLVDENGDEKAATCAIRRNLWRFSIAEINEKYGHYARENVLLAGTLAKWQQKLDAAEEDLLNDESKAIYIELLGTQRNFLIDMNRNPEVDEEIIRREIALIDIEEHRVRML